MEEAVINALINSMKKVFYQAHGQASIARTLEKNTALDDGNLIISGDSFSLASFEKIIIAGAGIASFHMAQHLSGLLKERISQGIILVPPGFGGTIDKIKTCSVTSPMVDGESQKALRDFLYIIDKAGEGDLVIFLLSKGAGEALESLPPGVSFHDYNILIKTLKLSGAREHEIDSVKMHLSSTKGGQLIGCSNPATAISIILSDQPGGDIYRTFQSPTSPDPTTFSHCRQLLIRHKIPLRIPPGILNHFNQGMQGKVPDTIKPDDERLSNVYNYILQDCTSLAADALTAAESLGFTTSILSTHLEGDPMGLGGVFGAILKDIVKFGIPLQRPCVFIGTGRINDSEMDRLEKCCALAIVVSEHIRGFKNACFLAATSFQYEKKGIGGCIVDGDTYGRILKSGSYPDQIISDKKASQTLKGLGCLFPATFCPSDCGDLFLLAAG